MAVDVCAQLFGALLQGRILWQHDLIYEPHFAQINQVLFTQCAVIHGCDPISIIFTVWIRTYFQPWPLDGLVAFDVRSLGCNL